MPLPEQRHSPGADARKAKRVPGFSALATAARKHALMLSSSPSHAGLCARPTNSRSFTQKVIKFLGLTQASEQEIRYTSAR
jgi:hypothetical protein